HRGSSLPNRDCSLTLRSLEARAGKTLAPSYRNRRGCRWGSVQAGVVGVARGALGVVVDGRLLASSQLALRVVEALRVARRELLQALLHLVDAVPGLLHALLHVVHAVGRAT